MRDSNDYAQPEFFRFGWDSLFLVREVARSASPRTGYRLLELGIGSGVVSCELSRSMAITSVTGVEAQPEWKPFLDENLIRFCRAPSEVRWQKVSEFNREGTEKFDLIVSNPPYFDPKRGRPSPDPQRNAAHRLVLEPWEAWVRCLERSLSDDGEAFFLQKDPGPQNGPVPWSEGFEVSHSVRSGPLRVLRLTKKS